VQETVTVSGEAPLVNVASSQLGGNIDSRQMQELPVNGRNFLDLTLLAPGNRANHTEPGGVPVTTGLGTVQINVDGMQVTNNCCGGANRQPSFGRDAIAEFQFISNRFDATQGRSSGAQVNVITKSGTNALSGSLSGTIASTRRTSSRTVCCRTRTSRSARRPADRSGATGCTSSSTTSTSASRRRSLTTRRTRASTSI
jgi:hypothetical protein